MNDLQNSNHKPLVSQLFNLLSIVSVAAGMIYCNGGIGIGSSNHVGLLPVVRRILDPNYLPGDFNIALRFYHHRAFAYLVAGGSALLGEDRALAVLGVMAMLAISAALFGLCSQMGLSRVGFLVVAAFAATRFLWTGKGLEANEFLGDPEVMPPHLAHALALLVLTALIREKFRLAIFLTGLTILLHLQIGVTLALMTSYLYITRLREFGWKETALLLVLAIIPASPALWHVAQMLQQGLAGSSISSAYYIDFRHPHHFELSSAAAAFWVTAHLLMIGLVYVIFFFRPRDPETRKAIGKLFICGWSLVELCLIHFADYYLVKNDKLAQVQFLRLTPLVTILGAICLVLLVNRWLTNPKLALAVNVALIVAAAIWGWHSPRQTEVPYYFGVKRFADEPSNWVNAALWVKANGPRDTVYLVPPGRNGFSVLSERSIVAEFKLNPDGSRFLAEWFERLRDLSGGELPTGRGFENRRPLDRAFAKLTNEQLLALSQKYNARYAVLHKDSKAQFEIVYQNKDYRVVKLQ